MYVRKDAPPSFRPLRPDHVDDDEVDRPNNGTDTYVAHLGTWIPKYISAHRKRSRMLLQSQTNIVTEHNPYQ